MANEVKGRWLYMGERDVDSRSKNDDQNSSNSLSRDFIPSPDALRFEEKSKSYFEVLLRARQVDNHY